jgi:hypothetical protein
MRDHLLSIVSFWASAIGALVTVITTIFVVRSVRKSRQQVKTKEGSLARGAEVEDVPLPPSAFDEADEPDKK